MICQIIVKIKVAFSQVFSSVVTPYIFLSPNRRKAWRTQEWEERRNFRRLLLHVVHGHCLAGRLDVCGCCVV